MRDIFGETKLEYILSAFEGECLGNGTSKWRISICCYNLRRVNTSY